MVTRGFPPRRSDQRGILIKEPVIKEEDDWSSFFPVICPHSKHGAP